MTIIRPGTSTFGLGQTSISLPILVRRGQTISHWNRLTKGSSFLPSGRGQEQLQKINICWGQTDSTNISLLSKGGDDRDLLTTDERNENNYNRLSYINKVTSINRQYEGAAYPGRNFSKFIQDRRNTSPYVLQLDCSSVTRRDYVITFAAKVWF